ncbi:MAG: hypothetical protein M3O89_00415 [Actinomycetota bacterium]|nr:hypothetical protein [Actinomycetota bacterium]
MEKRVDRVPDEVARTLEHEMRLVRDAIALVVSGASRRVIVASLRLSGQLIDPGRRLADEAGVRLVPLWHTDEAGADIAIERETDAEA